MDRELQCADCHNYLSVFPIYSYDHGESICGRCKPVETNNPQRQYAYEVIARFLKFPCCYKANGCLEEMTPSELATHEKSCRNRTFACIPNCFWQGTSDEILPHFRQVHPLSVYKEATGKLIDLTTVQQWEFLLHAMNKVFMLHVRLVDRTLLGIITLIGPEKEAKEYFFDLSLDDDVPTKKMEVHPETKKLNFDAAYYLEVGDAQSARLQASVIKNKTHLPPPKKQVNSSMLQKMECTVCLNVLLPPIWQCRNGHCQCDDCRSTCKQCPTCQVEGIDIRNLMLEDILDEINYPCGYDECYEILTGPMAKMIHEKSCEYAPYKCPFCMAELKYSPLVPHIKKEHQQHILINDEITICVGTDMVQSTFLLMRYECLFLFTHSYANQNVSLDVQFYGPRTEDNKFDYIVTVKKGQHSNIKLELRLPCSSMSGNGDPVCINEGILNIFKEHIELTYHIDIVLNNKKVVNIRQLSHASSID